MLSLKSILLIKHFKFLKYILIPKIIHQTWIDANVPVKTFPWIASWKKFHTNWEYVLWTDKDNALLCQEEFPCLLNIYNNYLFNIQRADVIRYMILYSYGGIYSDIDTECILSLKNLIDKDYLLFKWLHIITNYLMAAHKNSDFFKFVLNNLEKPNIKFTGFNKKEFILTTTGPIFLYNCYKEYFKDHEVLNSSQYAIHYNMGSWC